jgi:hypothetical protein
MSPSELRRFNIDGHALKDEWLEPGATAQCDIFKDSDGRLWLGPNKKRTREGEDFWLPTDRWID